MADVKAVITAIGEQALSAKDPMVILFDESASPELRAVAVIQKFAATTAQRELTLADGDLLIIDGTTYPIEHVGSLVNENIRTIGHVTLIFGDEDPQDLQNALYLTATVKPDFKIGTELVYHHLEQ